MLIKFCQFCGEPLENDCDCQAQYDRYIAERTSQVIEDYENSPRTQYGWGQQDAIDMMRYER